MKTNIFSLDESFLNYDNPKYVFNLYKILYAYKDNKEKGIRIAKEEIKSKDFFLKIIEKFKKNFINANEFLSDLNDITLSYDEKNKKTNNSFYSCVSKEEQEEDEKLLKVIYDSGLSKIDYFFYNYTPISFNQYFYNRCYSNDEIALEINNREDKTMPLLLIILKSINNKEIDYVGYYELTKLNPFLLISIAKENNLYTKVVANFIRMLRTSESVVIERELNGTLVINSEEISKETKKQAIEYLNSIEAPIDSVVYNNMIKRLIKKC